MEKRPDTMSVEADILSTESHEKKGDVHTSPIFRAAPKSSCALCQKNKQKKNSIVLSKCNSAIQL